MEIDQAAQAMRDEEMLAGIEDFIEGFTTSPPSAVCRSMGFGSLPGHPSTGGPGMAGQMRSGSTNVAKPMLSSAKGHDGILQRLHTGEPQRYGSGIEPAKLLDESRNTHAETVCLPGRPGKFRGGLDE